jgi:ubiquinone/menaquinone biosynthesis C-methylase UbiE
MSDRIKIRSVSDGSARGWGPAPLREGWHGWDAYAPFYDWENAQTLDRQDVKFWRDLAQRARRAQQAGPADTRVLELGCGTGRITIPVARTGVRLVGIDRSPEMLVRARRRLRRAKLTSGATLVRGDIRALPFRDKPRFNVVMAPYGILQSLVRESDLNAALQSVARVLTTGGVFGVDLVPDLPAWREYHKQVRFRGWRQKRGAYVTLVESVRQDRLRRLTMFDQEYIERRGTRRTRSRFSLTFRTISVPQMRRRLERAGFRVTAVLGDYSGKPWDSRADVWLILAQKC